VEVDVSNSGEIYTVALEEHYCDPDLVALFSESDRKRSDFIAERLFDMGELRLREMDEGGIDLQVLSHAAPATQKMEPTTAVAMARQTNDRLARFVERNPERYAGLGVLPTPAPEAAADELERMVADGLKGAMVNGLTNGRFLDEKQFWPMFARAEKLDVPIYLHPSFPSPVVSNTYYDDYAKQYPELVGPVWGFTVETATQAIRLILSGVFEAHPRLKFILGHLGETLPFLLWRIDDLLARPVNGGLAFSEVFRRHFYLTTSGNFSDAAFACSVSEMGIDRVLFSVDWPFASNKAGTAWIERLGLTNDEKAKVLGGNARSLLKL
jgi:predicted TIM-barrel fold metal-dependent hydrolase